MTLHQADIDGVPVFWVEGPAPLTAHLIFRVGVRDESLVTAGVTHLVEHLVMAALPDRHHEHNATVDLAFTSFEASGRPESIVSFLEDVCSSIRQPDLGRLEVEKKVLEAEMGSAVNPAIAEHLLYRYGLSTIGLSAVNPPALGSINQAAVQELIRSHFTAGNAALALSGPPPHNLSLHLPPGPRKTAAVADPLPDLPLPMWFEQGGPHLGLSFDVPASSAGEWESANAAASIACRRARTELRRERGLIYDIDYQTFLTGHGRATLCFVTDPAVRDANEVRSSLTRILQNLREQGPTGEELAVQVADRQEYLADPRTGIDAAIAAAESHLMGRPPVTPSEKLAHTIAVTRQTCQASLQHLNKTLMVGMPEGCSPEDDSLKSVNERNYRQVSGRTFRRSILGGFLGVPRGGKLIIGDAGVSLVDEDTRTILWEDIRGLERTGEGQLTLHSTDALSLDLHVSWFSKGREALSLISDHVEPHLEFDGQVIQ